MMKFALSKQNKNLISFFLALLWGISLVISPFAFPAGAQSTNALLTNPLLAAELAGYTADMIKNPQAKNNVVQFRRRNQLTNQTRVISTTSPKSILTGALVDIGVNVASDLISNQLQRWFWPEEDSDQIDQLRAIAFDRYSQANPDPSLDPTQQIPGTVLAFYRNGSFESYISRAAFNFNINSQGDMRILYYNSSTNRSTSCSGGGSNASLTQSSSTPYSFTRVSCATGAPFSSGSPTSWDDLTDQQKDDALDTLTPDELLEPWEQDPNGPLTVDSPPGPGEVDEICVEGSAYVQVGDSFQQLTDECRPINQNDQNDQNPDPDPQEDPDDGQQDENGCLECNDPDWAVEPYPNFFQYAFDMLRLRFPFDILGDIYGVSAQEICPLIQYQDLQYEACFVNDVFRPMKWLLSILYIVSRLIPVI